MVPPKKFFSSPPTKAPSEVAVKGEEMPASPRPPLLHVHVGIYGGDSSNSTQPFKAASLDASTRLMLAGGAVMKK